MSVDWNHRGADPAAYVDALIQRLPNILRGVTLGGDYSYEKVADRAVLVPSEGTVPYTLDGDVHVHEGKVEVRCGPLLRIVIA